MKGVAQFFPAVVIFVLSVAHPVNCRYPRHCAHVAGNLLTQEEKLSPSAKRVIVNVGSHGDPPTPFDDETVVFAVEPHREVAAKIQNVPNRYILTAALSDSWGLAAFNHYDDSSSLLVANVEDKWIKENVATKGRQGEKIVVPTLPLSAVLKAVQHLDCWFMKIDTQGMDFKVFKSGHREVQRCQYVMAETYCNGFAPYVGAQNDFDAHWLPYMRTLGFEPVIDCGSDKRRTEKNILWRNTGRQVEDLESMKKKCEKCFQ